MKRFFVVDILENSMFDAEKCLASGDVRRAYNILSNKLLEVKTLEKTEWAVVDWSKGKHRKRKCVCIKHVKVSKIPVKVNFDKVDGSTFSVPAVQIVNEYFECSDCHLKFVSLRALRNHFKKAGHGSVRNV